MAITYPTSLDSFIDPSGTSPLTSPDHAQSHSNTNDIIVKLEQKVGLGAGTPTAANMLLVGTGNGTAVWGSTVNNLNLGTPAITGGTADNQIIGTPAITGGTITAYQSTFHVLGSAASSPGTATTGTLNLSSASRFLVNMPNAAGQVTLAISNATPNQPFIIEILQGTAGLGTINWFSTIRWQGSATPTQTFTASRKDTFGFITTGAATFDGYIVGANL